MTSRWSSPEAEHLIGWAVAAALIFWYALAAVIVR